MTEKVKVTREQAELINNLLLIVSKQQVLTNFINGDFNHDEGSLKELSVDDIARILYEPNSYEVEPEFKVGDWVVHSNGNIIRQIEKVEHNRVNVTDGENGYVWGISYIRHATPSEIAEEKERRWWRKHGREPWELRIGDVLQNKHTGLVNIIVVTGFEDGKPIFGHGNWHDYKRNYRIVCFAKDRLDVKPND